MAVVLVNPPCAGADSLPGSIPRDAIGRRVAGVEDFDDLDVAGGETEHAIQVRGETQCGRRSGVKPGFPDFSHPGRPYWIRTSCPGATPVASRSRHPDPPRH